MTSLIAAEEVTLQNLISHLTENGFSPVPLNDTQVRIHTESGIGFRITILDDRQFIYIGTYLPLNRTKTRDEKIAFLDWTAPGAVHVAKWDGVRQLL